MSDSSLPRCCRRHRRNSDVTAESLLSRHAALAAVGGSSSSDKPATLGAAECHSDDLVCDSERALGGVAAMVRPAEHMHDSHAPVGSSDSLTVGRNSRQHCNHSRKHSVPLHRNGGSSSSSSSNEGASDNSVPPPPPPPALGAASTMDSIYIACAALRTVGPSFLEAIKRNTHDEPMSSTRALSIFNTVFPATHRQQQQYSLRAGAPMPEHDSSCGQCVSEALVTAHQAAAAGKGVAANGNSSGFTELRMNLGDGRNAVYVAPCERHLECPLEKKGKYLIHTNRPRIMTDMSKVEFGIRVDGWKRVVFKTVNDPALAERELSFYKKAA
ncbi:hypothetical protein GGF42_007438, partial [Coemansia sp. RSA 2424]